MIPLTLEDQISDNDSNELSYKTFHNILEIYNTQSDHTIQVPLSSLLDKYRDPLSNIILSVELNNAAMSENWYQPKRTSTTIYGVPDFWDTLLVLNNAVSILEFTPKILYYYNPSKLKSYLSEILINEGIV